VGGILINSANILQNPDKFVIVDSFGFVRAKICIFFVFSMSHWLVGEDLFASAN
jgi:hypothetical protein